MRALVLAAALAAPLAALGTVPALAQSGTTPGTMPGATSGAMPGGNGAAASSDLRTRLQEDLARAGFTQIQVVPDGFAVHAVNSAGQKVFMLVSPDSVTEVMPATPAQKPAPGTTKE